MQDKIFGYMARGYYFRYQLKEREIKEGEKSFGMIYATEEEAIEEGRGVLPGKSCMDNPYQLWTGWGECFDEDYDILVFKGIDTDIIGHDGELVCEFIKEIDRIDRSIIENWMYDNFEDYTDFQKKYWDFKY